MSVSLYRGQVDRLTSELAQLEQKAAGERDRASRERGDGLRAVQSITKSTSPSTAQTRTRDAQRHEDRAVRHDRQAAQYATQLASRRRALSDAQRRLSEAEASERKKASAQADRERRAEQRLISDLGRARRIPAPESHFPDDVPLSAATFGPVGARERDSSARHTIARLEPDTYVDAALEVSKALALAALSSVPVLGPVLREVVGVAWGDHRADRLQHFAVQLAAEVETLEDRVDSEFVKLKEFEALAEETLERIVLRRNEEKIRGFAAAMAHSVTVERPNRRTRERYFDWLDQLRPIHFQILGRLAAEPPGWTRPQDVTTVGQVANSRVARVLDGLSADALDMGELERRGLVRSLDDTATLLAVADNAQSLLTPVAHRFIEFVRLKLDDANPLDNSEPDR